MEFGCWLAPALVSDYAWTWVGVIRGETELGWMRMGFRGGPTCLRDLVKMGDKGMVDAAVRERVGKPRCLALPNQGSLLWRGLRN